MSEVSHKKLDPSFWLSLFFTAVIALLVGTALRLDWDTRLFPWAIGIPALALAVCQLLTDWRGAGANIEQGEATPYAGVLDIPVDKSISPQEMFRHTVKAARWIFAFAFGIWFVGFLISIPLFVFFYLVYEAQAHKLVGLIIAGLTFLFVWGIFDRLMHLAWPEAALFTLLGIKF
jgi:hypothetical protein